jgi:hypothetical protein
VRNILKALKRYIWGGGDMSRMLAVAAFDLKALPCPHIKGTAFQMPFVLYDPDRQTFSIKDQI